MWLLSAICKQRILRKPKKTLFCGPIWALFSHFRASNFFNTHLIIFSVSKSLSLNKFSEQLMNRFLKKLVKNVRMDRSTYRKVWPNRTSTSMSSKKIFFGMRAVYKHILLINLALLVANCVKTSIFQHIWIRQLLAFILT